MATAFAFISFSLTHLMNASTTSLILQKQKIKYNDSPSTT